jgi:hypothetical protein
MLHAEAGHNARAECTTCKNPTLEFINMQHKFIAQCQVLMSLRFLEIILILESEPNSEHWCTLAKFTLSNTHNCAQITEVLKAQLKILEDEQEVCTRDVNYIFARAIFLALKHFTYTHVCRRQHCASTSLRRRSRPSSKWLIHNYTTHSCSRHDQFTCSTRLTHMCETRLIDVVWHGPFNMLDKTRAYMCDMTCSRVWHDSSEALGLNAHPHVWLIQMCVCMCGSRCRRRRLHVAPSILL